MLKGINLSLSTRCGAQCVYCPQDRGCNLKLKDMPMQLIRKICSELNSDSFKANHNVGTFQLSENGDAMANKDFIEILRYLKEKTPGIRKIMYSNLAALNKKKAQVLLEEGLINRLVCSIDSVDKDTFFRITRLPFDKVMRNFKDFMKLRNDLNSDVNVIVRVLTLHSYANSVGKSLKISPHNVNPFEVPMLDEERLIWAYLDRFLDEKKEDKIEKSVIFGWNERDKLSWVTEYSPNVNCPFLERNQTELFIGPDGSCYSCCLDHKPDIVFGNVNKNSMDDIFNRPSRKLFLERLEDKEFIKIGGPCRTVICCLNIRK